MSFLSRIWNCFETPLPQYCHGTTSATLHMMGKQTDDDEHCLVPFGELAKKNIPCFAGECFRGLMDGGHNYQYTSWTPLETSDTAEMYSRNFPFQPQKILEKFQSIIADSDKQDSDRMVPYCFETHSAYWNKMILEIRQYRAWDEDGFQRDLAPGLHRWIDRVIQYFGENGSKHFVKNVAASALAKRHLLKKEISGPPVFQIPVADRGALLNSFPVVLITSTSMPDLYADGLQREVLFSRKMKLGRDIQWIATDAPHIEELQAYLRQKQLARKVSVISFEQLKELREHPPVPQSLGQKAYKHLQTYGKAYLGAAAIALIGIAKMRYSTPN